MTIPGYERDAKVDKDAPGDLGYRDGNRRTGPDAEHGRQVCDEEPCIDRVEEYLEDRVQAHDSGAVLAIPEREIVPDDHHRDAAGDPDQDQTVHQKRLVAEKNTARTNIRTGPTIQFWTSDRPSTFVSRKHVMSILVPHFCKRRVHPRMSPIAMGIDVVPTREAGDQARVLRARNTQWQSPLPSQGRSRA